MEKISHSVTPHPHENERASISPSHVFKIPWLSLEQADPTTDILLRFSVVETKLQDRSGIKYPFSTACRPQMDGHTEDFSSTPSDIWASSSIAFKVICLESDWAGSTATFLIQPGFPLGKADRSLLTSSGPEMSCQEGTKPWPRVVRRASHLATFFVTTNHVAHWLPIVGISRILVYQHSRPFYSQVPSFDATSCLARTASDTSTTAGGWCF